MNTPAHVQPSAAQRNPHPNPVQATHQGRVRYADATQLAVAPAGTDMTFQSVAATNYPVARHTWEGSYVEVLICTPEAVDVSRVTNGVCPLLANHNRWDFPSCLLGIVEGATFEAGQLILVGRFDSGPMGSDIARRVNVDRTLQAVSIGYTPIEAVAAGFAENGLPIVHITRWSLDELSFVSVPADPISGSRFLAVAGSSGFPASCSGSQNWGALPHPSMENHGAPQTHNGGHMTMIRQAQLGAAVLALSPGALQIRNQDGTAPAAPASNLPPMAAVVRNALASQTREDQPAPVVAPATMQTREDPPAGSAGAAPATGETPAATTTPTMVEGATGTVSAGEDGALSVQVTLQLRSQAESMGVGAIAETEMLRQGATAGSVRQVILTAAANNQRAQTPNGSAARVVVDASDARRAAMIEGLTSRALGRAPTGAYAEPARAYRGAKVVDIMEELMGRRSYDAPNEVLTRFHGSIRSAQHATSDFPIIMGAVAQNVVAQAYDLVVPSYRAWSARQDFNNFMPHSFLRLSDLPRLKPLGENGEIKAASFAESKETTKLDTLAIQLRLSRQMIINDQFGMFAQALTRWAEMVALQENELAYAGLKLAKLADGNFVFHASHANLAAAGTIIDEASLSAMRVAMRSKTGMKVGDEKGRKLNLSPATLLVGPNQETSAEKQLTAIMASTVADVNVFKDKMSLVVDAEIEGNEWYSFADPARAPTFVHGFLSGASGPAVLEDEPFGVDGWAVQCIHDFAVGAIDSVGGYKNPGQ